MGVVPCIFSGVWGRSPQRMAILEIYYQNNAFLGMFQLKFCLKTFETCSLLRPGLDIDSEKVETYRNLIKEK